MASQGRPGPAPFAPVKLTATQGLLAMPLAARWAVLTATAFGAVGGAVGLVVGLAAYAPTAPFAVLEIGLPASACGAVIGGAAGAVKVAWRRVRS